MAGSDFGMSPMDGMTPGAFEDDDTVKESSVARTEPFSTLGGLPSDTTVTCGGNGVIQNDIAVGRRTNVNRQTSELPTRPSTGGFGSDTDQLDLLGRDVKRMMDTITQLRVLGFETSVMSLPKIVVIGDQSTGKSSVIEAISDIKVPRSAGTCTRCPLEVNLTHSDRSWVCKVYLSRAFVYNPSKQKIDKAHKYGPWDDQDTPDVSEFAVLHDKTKVAEALKWAQVAILNPGTSWKLYRPGYNHQMLENPEVEFSPNVVRVDISGPGIANLCFYDLPGVISHVGDDSSQYLVKLVDNLAREYMKAEDTIILLTLTMNHDVQNSKAASLIKKSGADHRTIGVFTKPDLLSPEAHDQFVSVFENRTFKRPLGYYAVKNNPDPLVSHSIARQEEKAFFKKWVSQYRSLGPHKHRFGTESLTKELSKQLVMQITQSLPKIREIVDQKIEELEDHLEQLPKPPSGNFSLEVANSLGRLAQDIKALFNPESEEFEFYQQWSKLNDDFCRSLTGSHPELNLGFESSNSLEATSRSPAPRPSRPSQEVIDLDDDDANATPSARATPAPQRSRKRRPEEVTMSTNKRQRTDSSKVPQKGKKLWTLPQIRDLIRRKNDTGLRGLDNPRVTKDIFAQSIGHWDAMINSYLGKIKLACGRAVMDIVRNGFLKQRETQLYKKIQDVARPFLVESFNDHAAFAKRCLNNEKIMFTLNPVASSQIKTQVLRDLRDERIEERIKQETGDEVLSEQQMAKKAAAVKKELDTTPDEFDAEIQQMATVRGYYDYAATRLAENTAISFRSEVFTKIREQLCAHLTKELRLEQEDANAYLGKLLEMDPSVASERARCEQELERLKEGLGSLDDLERGASDSSGFDDGSTQSTVL